MRDVLSSDNLRVTQALKQREIEIVAQVKDAYGNDALGDDKLSVNVGGINAGKTKTFTIPFTSLYTKIITDKNCLINVTVKGDGVILNKGSWNVKTEWWRKSKKIGGVSHDHFDVTLKMK